MPTRRPSSRHPTALRAVLAVLLTASALAVAGVAGAQSLRGSQASLDRQNRQARAHDFTYLADPSHVTRFVGAGLLVQVDGNADYALKDVSFPYTRPEVRLFIERLGAQFRAACGETLVVTSLTRPQSNQPSNASRRSVHPTGMAVDLRRFYDNRACQRWLDRVLLSLEAGGVLEATIETRPPHYHVALFPRQYARYVEGLTGRAPALASAGGAAAPPTSYEVQSQDTLWRIARRHGTTPQEIQVVNGLSSTTIFPGQVLKIPAETGAR